MKKQATIPLNPTMAFWGICIIATCWIALTFALESHLGWPATGGQWIKRLIGWAVEIYFIRALVLGVRRCQGGRAKSI